tara:strand:- start:1002 stop:1736 length:735 start_codon:yes stop_codon:yes gene_type:complete
MKIRTVSLMMAASALAANAQALDFDVYNPGAEGIFPVASTLVSGPSEVMLVDAQFSTRDGDELVKMIQASGKQLTTIYISAGDPDYYFGLEPLVAAFPEARVIASPAVVKHIEATRDAKMAYWGPKLGDGAPEKVVVPEASSQTRFEIDGESLEVREINTHQAFLWAPGDKTVLGGVAVNAGSHVWTADTQTKASREQWQQGLGKILALDPQRVIPGHFVGEAPEGGNSGDIYPGLSGEFRAGT